MSTAAITENERWLLSFYRTSEISGALFFGRLAKTLPPGPIQNDLTKHFADESAHAHYWTNALNQLNLNPIKLETSYQDQYISAAGMPTNIMEILAITLIFEKRVIGQYSLHNSAADLHPVIRNTFTTIMNDEKWHIDWVTQALKSLETEYGEDHIKNTLKRFREADQEVYQKTISEHSERISNILKNKI